MLWGQEAFYCYFFNFFIFLGLTYVASRTIIGVYELTGDFNINFSEVSYGCNTKKYRLWIAGDGQSC